ncbi:MAG: sigma-70 family RNA polymerase sigma factor [Chloroflexota bacterium]|nr:MAG: sigma-70 family RNA polymerase sigma factor [Chloroflexota bacterium]
MGRPLAGSAIWTESRPEEENVEEEIGALLEQARRGDQQALEVLVERYRPLLLKNSRRAHWAGLADGDDLFQEAVKHFLELLREFRPERCVSFGAYMKAKHAWRMANYVRHERGQSARAQALDELAEEVPDGHDPFHGMANVAVRESLASLTRRQREVLWRYHVLGQSAETIGQFMNIGIRAVHGLKRRAELRLRELLHN